MAALLVIYLTLSLKKAKTKSNQVAKLEKLSAIACFMKKMEKINSKNL